MRMHHLFAGLHGGRYFQIVGPDLLVRKFTQHPTEAFQREDARTQQPAIPFGPRVAKAGAKWLEVGETGDITDEELKRRGLN